MSYNKLIKPRVPSMSMCANTEDWHKCRDKYLRELFKYSEALEIQIVGLQAKLKAAQEPDMIWDASDPESNYGDCLWSFASEYNAQTDFEGDLEVMVGIRLPNRIMRIRETGIDEQGYKIIEAEWIKPLPPENH